MCNSCPGPVFLLDQAAPAKRSRSEKKNRLPHPYNGIIKMSNGKNYTRNQKQKDLPTESISSSEFLWCIIEYLTNFLKEGCCVLPTGEARKCDCFSFLANKPNIVDLVARTMKTYFDLEKLCRNFVLASKQRYANRLINDHGGRGGAAKAYQLTFFGGS